jgi:hypothetical protein
MREWGIGSAGIANFGKGINLFFDLLVFFYTRRSLDQLSTGIDRQISYTDRPSVEDDKWVASALREVMLSASPGCCAHSTMGVSELVRSPL